MPYEVVDEIFELCKRALLETKSYVEMSISSFEKNNIHISVYMQDNGYVAFKPFDGAYRFVCNEDKNYVLCEEHKKTYEICKAHLERLIKGGAVGV